MVDVASGARSRTGAGGGEAGGEAIGPAAGRGWGLCEAAVVAGRAGFSATGPTETGAFPTLAVASGGTLSGGADDPDGAPDAGERGTSVTPDAFQASRTSLRAIRGSAMRTPSSFFRFLIAVDPATAGF